MSVYLPDLEPFYNTGEFLVDLQSGELFVKLQGKWHPAGLTCKKRNFEVNQLMALIQHASIKLKTKLYGRKDDQTAVLTLDPSEAQPPQLPFIPDTGNYTIQSKPMSPAMRKNYIKDRAQAAVTYITEYGNTMLWNLENLVPEYKLTQCLQIIFGRTDAVREAVDRAIENDDEIRRKKCMCYLKPPKRFAVPEDMGKEETAMWISWIHLETQALIEDLNKEIRLQNDKDDPFTRNIVYAPLNPIQGMGEAANRGETIAKSNFTGEISPDRHTQQHEEKLASPLPVETASNPLPQHTRSKHSEILPVNKEFRDALSKPPVHNSRVNNTRQQINYDRVNWEGNDTSYLQMPNTRQQPVLEQFSINDTTDIRLCH